jgi:predicted AAA+ superfamily ATPase
MQKRSKFVVMIEIKRDIKIPESSFFLFGPRGTGKSTFVKSLINKGSLYIDFLEPDTFRKYNTT